MAVFESWKIRTFKVKPRSAELKKLDDSVSIVATNGAGVNDGNVLSACNDFQDWKSDRPTEYTTIQSVADELETELLGLFSKGKSQLSSVVSTPVVPVGWTKQNWNSVAYPWTEETGPLDRVNLSFTNAETMRMNEAIRRAKRAAVYARDALIRIAGGKGSAIENEAYADFFGAFNQARVEKVLLNFRILTITFERGLNIVDVRNTRYGKTCFAACFRNSLAAWETKKGQKATLSVTGAIEMFLGRAFFASGNYEKTTDDTIDTLVHEFAHGAVNAVDVPPVDAFGAWTHARKSDDPAHIDFGETTDNRIQASTKELAKLLAVSKPEYALVNADSYGEFATRLLTRNHG